MFTCITGKQLPSYYCNHVMLTLQQWLPSFYLHALTWRPLLDINPVASNSLMLASTYGTPVRPSGINTWVWPYVSSTMPHEFHRLVGLVVEADLGAKDPKFESHLRQDFSGSSHTSDLKIGTPVATLGAWRYRVSAGTGRLGDSILWLCEAESLICNFYLSVAAHKIVCADPSLRYTSMLLGL